MFAGDAQKGDDFDVLGCLETLASHHPDRCSVAPSPDLSDKIRAEVDRLQGQKRIRELAAQLNMPMPRSPGLNDGLIIPGSYFPLGTSVDRVRSAAADRAPLHGSLKVIVVLVDFSDKAMTADQGPLRGAVLLDRVSCRTAASASTSPRSPTDWSPSPARWSVRTGCPRRSAQYAHGASGTGSAAPNARTMAKDAAVAANADVNYARTTTTTTASSTPSSSCTPAPAPSRRGSTGDIWSHKWVLAGGEYSVDSTKIYAYLTVPEDARIGVCAHELGHLLFGFPDLYDTDDTSEGIGNWCLMAGGPGSSWGARPATCRRTRRHGARRSRRGCRSRT